MLHYKYLFEIDTVHESDTLNDNAQSHLSPSLSPFWVVESYVIT